MMKNNFYIYIFYNILLASSVLILVETMYFITSGEFIINKAMYLILLSLFVFSVYFLFNVDSIINLSKFVLYFVLLYFRRNIMRFFDKYFKKNFIEKDKLDIQIIVQNTA